MFVGCASVSHIHTSAGFFSPHAALSIALLRALVSHHLPLQGEKRVCLAQKLLQKLTFFCAGSCGRSPEGGDHIKRTLIPLLFLVPAHAELQLFESLDSLSSRLAENNSSGLKEEDDMKRVKT